MDIASVNGLQAMDFGSDIFEEYVIERTRPLKNHLRQQQRHKLSITLEITPNSVYFPICDIVMRFLDS